MGEKRTAKTTTAKREETPSWTRERAGDDYQLKWTTKTEPDWRERGREEDRQDHDHQKRGNTEPDQRERGRGLPPEVDEGA